MKIQLATIATAVLMFSSCMKTRTCTCSYPDSGEVYAMTSKKTNSKKDIKDFEDKCKAAKLVVTTESTSSGTSQTAYSDVCKLN